jgi:hypothetical protein
VLQMLPAGGKTPAPAAHGIMYIVEQGCRHLHRWFNRNARPGSE